MGCVLNACRVREMWAERPGIRKQLWDWRVVSGVSFLLSCIVCSKEIPNATLLVFREFVAKYLHADGFGLHSDVPEACRGFQEGLRAACKRILLASPCQASGSSNAAKAIVNLKTWTSCVHAVRVQAGTCGGCVAC